MSNNKNNNPFFNLTFGCIFMLSGLSNCLTMVYFLNKYSQDSNVGFAIKLITAAVSMIVAQFGSFMMYSAYRQIKYPQQIAINPLYTTGNIMNHDDYYDQGTRSVTKRIPGLY